MAAAEFISALTISSSVISDDEMAVPRVAATVTVSVAPPVVVIPDPAAIVMVSPSVIVWLLPDVYGPVPLQD